MRLRRLEHRARRAGGPRSMLRRWPAEAGPNAAWCQGAACRSGDWPESSRPLRAIAPRLRGAVVDRATMAIATTF